jgi:hypothetical protein
VISSKYELHLPALCTNQSCNRQCDTQCAGHRSSGTEVLISAHHFNNEVTQINSNSAVLKFSINHFQGFLLWKFWGCFTLTKRAMSQFGFYTIRGYDVENAMASSKHSQQGTRRSTCTPKYARNVAIFTHVYVGQYSCLTSKTNTKAPFVSGFSPDFTHRDFQNSLDGLLKYLSFSVLGLKPNSDHKPILISLSLS